MSVKGYLYALIHDQRQGLFDGIVKFFLWILSLVYGALARVRRFAYAHGILKSYHSHKPVISVGNITLGGVGKTPLVIAIVRALGQQGIRAAVLIRGYMPKDEMFSDEALMLKECLAGVPIITGADRRRGIEDCLKHHAVDVFVCDDAFGHIQLARDLNIVVIDAVNPFGNEQVVPRGILREPLSVLKYVDMVVLTKTDIKGSKVEVIKQQLAVIAPGTMFFSSTHKPKECVDAFDHTRMGLEHFKGVSVVGFCGIGDTNAFRHSLQESGFDVINVIGFMDHHVYTAQDMAMVRKCADAHQVKMIVTTHKDAVKLSEFREVWAGIEVYYLGIDLEITNGKNVFIERIVSVIRH